ncbi:MAG: hypothetical protein AAGI11_09960 [Pseudomonadota bacterium]
MHTNARLTSLRAKCLIFLFTLAVSPIGATAADLENRLVVANNMAGTLAIINPETWEIERYIDVATDRVALPIPVPYADDIIVLDDGDTAIISRPFPRDVSAYSLTSGELLWRIPTNETLGKLVPGMEYPVVGRPDHMTLGPKGKRLYVSILNELGVVVIDIASQTIIGFVLTGEGPHNVKINSDNTRGYVGHVYGDRFTEFDPQTLQVVEQHEFVEGVRPFLKLPDGEKFAMQLDKLHGFIIYDVPTKTVLKTVHLPEINPHQADFPHTAHHGLALSGSGDRLCVAGTVSDYTAIIDYPSLERRAIVNTPGQPSWAIPSSDGKLCFVSARKSDVVSVIDFDTGSLVSEITLKKGSYPQRMWTGPVRIR